MRPLLRLAFAALLAGCSLLARPPAATPPPAAGAGRRPASSGEAPSLEEEEVALEGLGEEAAGGEDPIAALIGSLRGEAGPEPPAAPPASPQTGGETAFDVWSLSDEACRALLDRAGIAVSVPAFETPLVRQPLLLDGPVDGVTIRPRWRREVRVNEVMDCRLVAALRPVAAAARAQGFSEVLFYSTYRPPKAGAAARKASMHRRALAIDVGWLTTADGEAVSVIDDYERHPGAPPCDAGADTGLGRRLRDFACALHAAKAFNVVLTPNANRAHHNHFHFDITPGARWYIVR